MTSPSRVLKSVGPKLVPFFKSVAVYFVLFIPVDKPSVWAMFVKCAPILSLMVFVLLHGMSLGDEYMFSRRILIGLIFSCLGDALLVWPHYFLHGMGAFSVAQVFYIKAFGFESLKPLLTVPLYGGALYVVSILLPHTSDVYTIGVPVYGVLLTTMVWRAIARVRFSRNQWTWTEICSCIGGMFFAISDGIIGFDRFLQTVPYSQLLIMTTYYMAQVGIALSVVDSSSVYKLSLQSQLKAETDDTVSSIIAGMNVSSDTDEAFVSKAKWNSHDVREQVAVHQHSKHD
ncbi:lysoplasmalogenase TMEM86A [Arctopsyche grandis]|uniref:lysoplasmalogenase TMEM86A n=1 Tax=Arctopsyche grandis TaxID=121162 RepID=UPI00406D8D90